MTWQSALDPHLASVGIETFEVDERSFPGELWLVVRVPEDSVLTAQSLAGTIEESLNDESSPGDPEIILTFRALTTTTEEAPKRSRHGRLADSRVNQLIQLLEARSRTSAAVPSLHYVEDPRASLATIGATRHQFIFGRRGVGKTALLLEAMNRAQSNGSATVWINAHVIHDLKPASAFAQIATELVATVLKLAGTSGSSSFTRLREVWDQLDEIATSGSVETFKSMAKLNSALKGILRHDLISAYIYLDDFYLYPLQDQPVLLDLLGAMFRDCNGWLKVASIDRLTRAYEPSTQYGLEIPHDATKIDLDVTLQDPVGAQRFLETLIEKYTASVGLRSPGSIAKKQALGRLVLASGGVPRDYMNLFSSSIMVARDARVQAQEIGKEDVAVAAGRSAQSKKRDLELDVSSAVAPALLSRLDRWSGQVKTQGFAYFRVAYSDHDTKEYEYLAQLVDLRFAHLVQNSISDQRKSGVRYEGFVWDLSEWSDVRLKRGLQVLDLEDGQWVSRLTGTAGTAQVLKGTMLRDKLRLSPVLDLDGSGSPGAT